ncbi:hypothetical protein UA08_07378 [Talaromyces atroroseus]|uniref:PEBP-like protein n=1 Tax=Talaromyces atroroseus TaxID=1441469 RepID=A0A225ADJ5_TALAT|nr:hypothetical protein UA08_07378 [Talaromyces atroroseus]OKL57043.1 hypothetical protein UA08_07378 [Talaromyces atroroseus]
MIVLYSLVATCTILSILLTAYCQTPPGYQPSSWQHLNVQFGHNEKIETGTVLTPSQAYYKPHIHAPDVLPIYPLYISFMIDVEVNHNGISTSMLHWYQPDLRISDSDGLLLNLTNNGADYVGPQPPPGPRHVYVLLLFVQPSDFLFPECYSRVFPISIPTRVGFDIGQFMRIAGLDEPVAANYFVAGNPTPASTPIPRIWTTSMSSARCESTDIL